MISGKLAAKVVVTLNNLTEVDGNQLLSVADSAAAVAGVDATAVTAIPVYESNNIIGGEISIDTDICAEQAELERQVLILEI